MSRKRIVVRISEDSWSARCFGAESSVPDGSEIELCRFDEPPASVVEAIGRLLPNPSSFAYTLLLDSPRVFVSRFPADEFHGANNRQELAFRFEEGLPVNAEDLLCDFVLPERKKQNSTESILALGTLRELVLGLNESFRSRGLQIESVASETLVHTQAAISAFALPENGCLLVPNTNSFDAVVWSDAGLIAWRHGLSPVKIQRDLQLLFGELQEELNVFVLSREDSNELVESLPPKLCERVLHSHERNFDDAYVGCITKRKELWSDFARDPALQTFTAAQQTQVTLLCASVCFLILCTVAWWKSWQFDTQRQRVRDEQTAVFDEAFPGQKAPNAVLKRMRSELAKARGASTPQADIELPTRSIALIQGIVSALPEAGQASIQQLRVNKQNATLTVHIPTHETAASIADRLRSAKFAVAPPTTETLRDTVRATITITLPEGV